MNALTNNKRLGTSAPKGSPSVNSPVALTRMAKDYMRDPPADRLDPSSEAAVFGAGPGLGPDLGAGRFHRGQLGDLPLARPYRGLAA
jgi:hypothetical protein